MRLLCITDLHGEHEALDRILGEAGAVDVILLGGDITNFGTPSFAERTVRQIQQRHVPLFAVAGNCDSEAIDQRLAELGVSLFGRGVVCQGVGFFGVSAMPPWQGTMYELTEEQIDAALEQGHRQLQSATQFRSRAGIHPGAAVPGIPTLPEGTSNLGRQHPRQVLLSHAPPRDTALDRTRSGDHVGSVAVRNCIERRQPSLVVCGHIHEARGVACLGNSQLVNCGPAYRGCYAIADVNTTVEIELRTIARAVPGAPPVPTS